MTEKRVRTKYVDVVYIVVGYEDLLCYHVTYIFHDKYFVKPLYGFCIKIIKSSKKTLDNGFGHGNKDRTSI